MAPGKERHVTSAGTISLREGEGGERGKSRASSEKGRCGGGCGDQRKLEALKIMNDERSVLNSPRLDFEDEREEELLLTCTYQRQNTT